MKKIQFCADGVDFNTIKPDQGFLDKNTEFGWTPIIDAKPLNDAYTRVETAELSFVMSIAAIKAAGLPAECDENTYEVTCHKGKLTSQPMK